MQVWSSTSQGQAPLTVDFEVMSEHSSAHVTVEFGTGDSITVEAVRHLSTPFTYTFTGSGEFDVQFTHPSEGVEIISISVGEADPVDGEEAQYFLDVHQSHSGGVSTESRIPLPSEGGLVSPSSAAQALGTLYLNAGATAVNLIKREVIETSSPITA